MILSISMVIVVPLTLTTAIQILLKSNQLSIILGITFALVLSVYILVAIWMGSKIQKGYRNTHTLTAKKLEISLNDKSNRKLLLAYQQIENIFKISDGVVMRILGFNINQSMTKFMAGMVFSIVSTGITKILTSF